MEALLQEIKNFFDDFEVSIRDLQNPTPIFVRDFFIRTLIELGVDDENVRKLQLSQNGVDQEEVEIVPELNLVTAVKQAFPFIDFGLMDLLVPNNTITFHQIRDVMRFLNFADTRVSSLNVHMEAYQGLQHALSIQLKKSDMMKHAANELALETNNCASKLKELEEIKTEMKRKLQHFSQELEELTLKKNSLKETVEKRKMSNNSIEQQLEMVDRKIAELKNEIVDHPEIDENKLEEIRNHLSKLSNRKEEAKNKLKEKKNEKMKCDKVLQLINDKLLPTCSSVQDRIQTVRDNDQLLINAEKEINRLETIKEGLLNKLNILEKNLLEELKRKDNEMKQFEQSEVQQKKALDDKEKKYTDEMSKFKIARKQQQELDKITTTITDITKRAENVKKMLEDLSSLADNKEKEFDDFVKHLSEQIRSQEAEFRNMINQVNRGNQP